MGVGKVFAFLLSLFQQPMPGQAASRQLSRFGLALPRSPCRVRTQHVDYRDSGDSFWVRLGAFEQTADFRSWQWMRPLVRNEAKFEFFFIPSLT